MKVGLSGSNIITYAEPEPALQMARAAEAAGVESLWTYEHIVVPAGYQSKYPYSPTGRMGLNPDQSMTDPLSWLTFVAAATNTIKLATGILILPEHNPVQLAKRAATIDRLSRGRLVLGVGVGWMKEEFEALGVPFERRGARANEYIDAMRKLWTEDEPSFDGEFVSYERAACNPKPVGEGGVEIVVGGHGPQAARRAGRRGDGFFPPSTSLSEMSQLLETMRQTAEEAGRDPDSIEITARADSLDPAHIASYREAGVSRVVIPVPTYVPQEIEEAFAGLGEEIAKLG